MQWSLVLLGCGLVLASANVLDNTPRDMRALHRLHQDPKAYSAMLDDPARDACLKPHAVITALRLREGEMLVDIGVGSGYFTFRFVRHVGDTGRVYAVDVGPDMIVHLNRCIRDLNLKNLVTIIAAPYDPLLADASVDRSFICDTWHRTEHHDRCLTPTEEDARAGQADHPDRLQEGGDTRGATPGDKDRWRRSGRGDGDQRLSMRKLPHGPIVGCLTHSVAPLCALHGALLVFVSLDVHRYLPIRRFPGWAAVLMDVIPCGVDRSVGMPPQESNREGTFVVVTQNNGVIPLLAG